MSALPSHLAIAQDRPGRIDVSPIAEARESIDAMLEGLFTAAPRVALAVAVMVVAWLIAKVTRRILEPRLARARTKSFGRVFATLTYAAILVAGFLVAVPVAFPTVNAVTMLSGLGLVGVAAGFAFQDILSNLLAGILLLFRQPFESGDQIDVDGIRGTVELITIRETRVRTFDGRRVYIPNADVYQNAIEVQTAFDTVRTSLVVGVDYDADLATARDVALGALAGIDGVLDDPAPEAYYTGFGASAVDLDLRYWTGSRQAEIRRIQDQVVERIKAAFDDAGIDIPFDIVTLDTRPSAEQAMRHVGADAAPAR